MWQPFSVFTLGDPFIDLCKQFEKSLVKKENAQRQIKNLPGEWKIPTLLAVSYKEHTLTLYFDRNVSF